MADEKTYEAGKHPDMEPPASMVGVVGWMRANLFSSPLNIFLTFFGLYLIYILVPPIVSWSITSSVTHGETRATCDAGRRAARLGEARTLIDPDDPGSRPTEKGMQFAQDFAKQLEETVLKFPKDLSPSLVEVLQKVDIVKAREAMDGAAKSNDPKAMIAEINALSPIIAWGEGNDGACWTFVKQWFNVFMYQFYPRDQQWRVNLAFIILIVVAIPLFIKGVPGKKWIGLFLLVPYPVIAFFLFSGGLPGLPTVETPKWGGLFLTLVIGGTGIVASLPIGIVLALGRRSNMPIIRALCTAFIELWRGVPLITVLFMSSVMFPLFLPEGMNFDKLIRALVGVALFSSAYMAEVIRGGLQAIPSGQYEAADALGLSYWKKMGLVVLPQALKLVIPGIVNTFIGLFKDTTLVLIIGLFDLLGSAQAAATNSNWLGFASEAYVFAGATFWICCFSMSRYSMSVERKLETGHKR